MTTLAEPTLFPIPPDGAFPITLSRAWLTDIQRPRAGKEVRLSLRDRPARRLEYKSTLAESIEIRQFMALWLAAAELLRFDVPVWPDDTDATAFPDDHTISCDTRWREFIAGEQAIIWWDETTYELVTIDTVDDDQLTTVDPIVGDWAAYLPAPLLVAPVMTAWLVPPTKEQRTPVVEHVTLVFDEELPGVAGIDPLVGESVTPDVDEIVFEIIDNGGTGDPGLRYFTINLFAFDAARMRIREPAVAWVVAEIGSTPATDPRHSFPRNGQQCNLEYDGDADVLFNVEATVGGSTINTNIPP